MVASTDLKFYVHTNNNAPQLTNNFGCMIDVLDACLVNGFGSQNVATLTASGMTVTATFGTAHNFMQYQVIKIAGANQAEFNGEHRILTVPNANTITFQLASAPSISTATGTMTCSLPPIDWLKPFSAAGKAAYRSNNTLLSSRPYLRVIDALDPAYTSTYAKYAKVGIVEDMTDIDTMQGVQAPYDSTDPNKNWVGTGSGASGYNGWAKWVYAAASDMSQSTPNTATVATGIRNWVVVGNSDYFYIFPASNVANTDLAMYGFGAFESYLNTDSSNVFLCSHISYAANNNGQGYIDGLTSLNAGTLLLFRDYTQASNYKTASSVSLNGGLVTSGYSNIIANANLTGNALFFPVLIKEDTTNVLRGAFNNIFWLFQQKPYNHLQLIEKHNQIFIAINAVGRTGYKGQIVLKVGDL